MDGNGTRRVLVVDDEEAILLAFSKVLPSPGVEVDTAATLDQARKLMSEHTYSVVIADLRMSGAAIMDGYVVISEAKKLQPGARVIVTTAYGGEATKDRVFALGADMYMEKPVSPKEVKDLLTSMGIYRRLV